MITSIVDRLDKGFTKSEKVRKFLKRTIDGFMKDQKPHTLIAPGRFYDPFISTGGRDQIVGISYSLLFYLYIPTGAILVSVRRSWRISSSFIEMLIVVKRAPKMSRPASE